MAQIIFEAGVEEEYIAEIHYFFSSLTSDELSFSSEVTDHIVEDGSSRQEHVVLPPLEFTIEGFVAEKVFMRELPFTDKISKGFSKLNTITALTPTVSSYMQTIKAASAYIESSFNRYKQIASNIFNKDKTATSKRQTEIANQLRLLRANRKLVTLSCDLGVFDNMLIESVRMRQEDTEFQSSLIVKLKQYNSVSTQLVKVNSQKYAGRCAKQLALEENLGSIQGKATNMSTLRSWVSPNIVPYFTGVN